MKRVKMALMALSAMTSIGSAFAFSPAAHRNLTTYYAVKTGVNPNANFFWTSTKPAATLSCQSTSLSAICSIQTANQPQDGSVPSGHTANGTVYR